MVFFRRNKIPKITKLDSNQNLKALLANEAYNKPNERKRNIMNFQLDEEFNDTIYAVYQNPQEKRVILAIRGTASASDLLTDVRLAIQQVSNLKTMDNSGRFQKLNRVLNDIFSK